jgi:hypothetical protein
VPLGRHLPAWDLKRAEDFARVCADHKIDWLEEPLDWHDYDGLAALKKRLLRKYGKRFYRITQRSLAFKVIREKGLKTALALKKRKEGQG